MAVNLLPANVPIGYVNNDLNQPIYASPELTRALTNMMLQIGGQTSASPGDVTGLTAIGIEHGIRISGVLPTPTPDDIEVWSSADNVLAHAVLQTHGLLSSWDWIGLTSADGVKYIWVRTVFKSGKKGNFVGPVSARAGINATPNPVTGLTAAPIIGGIRITGTLPSDGDLGGVEIWENTVSNVNTATLRAEGVADHYDRTGLLPSNGTYYFWARTYNSSGARGIFVGPVSAIAGQVQSGNIASGAVAVAAFASGIEPVTIVSSVPSVLSTNTVFNTTNGKLYRWNGSAYIVTTPTSDLSGQISAGQIAANAVTAGTIAANAVTTGTIAAGAVTASQISVSQLSALTANLGTVTAGNINGTANISITGSAQFEGALSSGGNTWAVVANSSGGSFGGVRGLATTGIGVQGTAAGANGVGLYGSASGAGGAGVVAAATGSATALNVSGPSVINNSSITWNGFTIGAPTSSANNLAKAMIYQTVVTGGKAATGQYVQLQTQDGANAGWLQLYA